MPRKDPVTPELRQAVFDRDIEIVRRYFAEQGILVAWSRDRLITGSGQGVCPAVVVDSDEIGNCQGRWTLDHIKDRLRLGRRAASDAAHLFSVCEGHSENGRKAGFQWNTANRPAIRAYLEQANKEA